MNDEVEATWPCEKLPEFAGHDVLRQEWSTYRREVARLVAEGHEGKAVMIKGDAVLGVFETWQAARAAGVRRFLREPFLVKVVHAAEPLLRVRGLSMPCRA